jgi:hypothetical protein
MLKPTVILALDHPSAVLCNSTYNRLERIVPGGSGLIQTYVLVSTEGTLKFEPPSALEDKGFDLSATRSAKGRRSGEDASQLVLGQANSLQPVVQEMIRSARTAESLQAARRAGVEIVPHQMFYLLITAADPFVGGLVLEIAKLIRWLYATRFGQDVYTLRAVVLLPGLFVHPSDEDFSSAYALLKRLDDGTRQQIFVTPQIKLPPFDDCWLMDSRNAFGLELGTLSNNLETYSDALAGFITAEPEMSGALPGTHKVRGMSPSFSAFGYGELFFPAEVALVRLSSILAQEILAKAFLAEGVDRPISRYRKILLAAKQFVLKTSFTSLVESLEREAGRLIWREFSPRTSPRDAVAREFVAELGRAAERFDRESLLQAKNSLVTRAEDVMAQLCMLLDSELDFRCDAGSDGMIEAIEFIDTLIDPAIAVHLNLLGDWPRNLITEQRAIAAGLDTRLGLTSDTKRTAELLGRLESLYSQLVTLRSVSRSLPNAEGKEVGAQDPSLADQVAEEVPAQEGQIQGEEKSRKRHYGQHEILKDIETHEEQVRITCEAYRQAVLEEDTRIGQGRHAGITKIREDKRQGVGAAEVALIATSDQLEKARLVLEDWLEIRRHFLNHYALIYPGVIALLAFGIPALLAIGDIGPMRKLGIWLWENLSDVSFWIVLIAVVYFGWVLARFIVKINPPVLKARTEVESLDQAFQAAGARLRQAHNDKLRFEYDLYAHDLRVEIVAHLISAAWQRASELRKVLADLAEARTVFAEQYQKAVPASSPTRRSVVRSDDIDSYYKLSVRDLDFEAREFTRQEVSRSQARRMKSEELREKLRAFALSRFSDLMDLSIQDILLRNSDFVSSNEADLRLRDLNNISAPLIQLREIDSNRDAFSQFDLTIWTSEKGEELLTRFRRYCPGATARTGNDKRTLQALSRHRYFPGYFLGQIEFYRDRYEHDNHKEALLLPDLIPPEFGLTGEVRRAYEQLLLAIALGIVLRQPNGEYILANRIAEPLGKNRTTIAEKLATDFAFQPVYAEVCTNVAIRLRNEESLVFQKLIQLLDSLTDLGNPEREILESLARRYHPLA